MLPVDRLGGDTGLELEADALAAAVDQKVDFGTGVGAKEIKAAARALQLFERDNLLNHEAFEAVAARRGGQQLVRRADSQQVMHNSAVAQVHFGCFQEP